MFFVENPKIGRIFKKSVKSPYISDCFNDLVNTFNILINIFVERKEIYFLYIMILEF